MKLTIESVNDEHSGGQFLFHGDADEKGLHSFAGTADDINTAFDMAKECIAIELEYWSAEAVPERETP